MNSNKIEEKDTVFTNSNIMQRVYIPFNLFLKIEENPKNKHRIINKIVDSNKSNFKKERDNAFILCEKSTNYSLFCVVDESGCILKLHIIDDTNIIFEEKKSDVLLSLDSDNYYKYDVDVSTLDRGKIQSVNADYRIMNSKGFYATACGKFYVIMSCDDRKTNDYYKLVFKAYINKIEFVGKLVGKAKMLIEFKLKKEGNMYE